MAVDEGRITAQALWAYSSRRGPGDRSSSPDSAKSGASAKAPRKRASKPKVRTGCLSCKRRHLKCDERKEGGCLRCETFGIPCEGYASPRPIKETKPARIERLLLPRPKGAAVAPAPTLPALSPATSGPNMNTTAAMPIPAPSVVVAYPAQRGDNSNHDGAAAGAQRNAPLPLSRPPSLLFDWEDDDNFYWSVFQNEVVEELSPYFESSFWMRLSLREGLMNDCIRHSVLSIGACYRAITAALEELNLRPGSPQHPSWVDTRRNMHHQAALNHHAKALSHLRQKMGSLRTDTRLTMIATLLFIAFENMQGNYHASGSLIRSGIKVLGSTTLNASIDAQLLHSTLQLPAHPPTSLSASPSSAPSSPHGPDSRSTPIASQGQATEDEDVAEMTQMFARLSTASVYMPFPHCKFAYHLLLDPRLTDPLVNRHIASYPSTLEQARAAWDFYLPVLGNFFQKAMWHNLNHAYDFDILDAGREQGEHIVWLRRFGGVLDLLRRSESAEAGIQDQDRRRGARPSYVAGRPMSKGLEMLMIQHLVATIYTTCCLDNTEMLYDAFLPQFGEILGRCQAFVVKAQAGTGNTRPRTRKAPFSNDAGLLPILGFVIAKCRNRAIRLEALTLVSRCDARECNWDSRSLSNGMAALVSLEEMGMDVLTGQIPAMARFVWTNSCWNAETRSMTMQFTRVLPDDAGEYEKSELTAGL
ncbi:hypothetical protein GQ53DRAFT_747682 [Thozetella sp. PMI_491]|nr:hypothetical protein GQ53DRAFT_747682 [Thozetella sp. PMI_491]